MNDAYKVNIYTLPDTGPYDEKNAENNKYRNTIIKTRDDWTWSDMGYVAEQALYYAKNSIANNQITIYNEGEVYNEINDIVLGVDTLTEITSYLPIYSDSVPGNTEKFTYNIRISSDNIIITMCTNWKDFLPKDTDKLVIFLKKKQVLTDAGQKLRSYIDARRLASLWITYYDISVTHPKVNIEIYMDAKNLEFNTIASKVKDFILDKYSRKYLKPGDAIFSSKMGADILDEFPDIKFLYIGFNDEITHKEYTTIVEVTPNMFIDIIPPNINITVEDYQPLKRFKDK